MKIVDLSRELYHRTPSYPGQPPVIHGVWKTHEEAFAESGNVQGNSVMFFSMPDHGGTHIDVRFGITRFGPLDIGDTKAPAQLRVGFVGTDETIAALRLWLERCRRAGA